MIIIIEGPRRGVQIHMKGERKAFNCCEVVLEGDKDACKCDGKTLKSDGNVLKGDGDALIGGLDFCPQCNV